MFVHGIGSPVQWQEANAKIFEKCVEKILRKKRFESKYKYAFTIIDWRSICDNSKMR